MREAINHQEVSAAKLYFDQNSQVVSAEHLISEARIYVFLLFLMCAPAEISLFSNIEGRLDEFDHLSTDLMVGISTCMMFLGALSS